MSLTSQQRQVLIDLKGRAVSSEGRIPVLSRDGETVAWLSAIGHELAAQPDVADKLCGWRAKAMESFLTVFPPSVEATRGYLDKLAVGGEDRLLFLIERPDGAYIGHIGLCNLTETSVEIDNVLRGESAPVAGFMSLVQAALTDWLTRVMAVDTIYLNVLSNNDKAIGSYARAGFVQTASVALRREDIPGGYRFVPDDGDHPENPRLVRMEISTIKA